MTLAELESLLKTVTQTFHYEASKAFPQYIVYSEYRKKYMHADNKPKESCWRVQVDFYTKLLDDPNPERLEELLSQNEVPYKYARIFDTDLKMHRHIFDCDGVRDG